jgi:hypothetical protein
MRSISVLPWRLFGTMIMVAGAACAGCSHADTPVVPPAVPVAKPAEPAFRVSMNNWSSSLNANSEGKISRSWMTRNPDSTPVQSLAAFIGHNAEGDLSTDQVAQVRGWFDKNEKLLFALQPQYGEESKDGSDRYGPEYLEFQFGGRSIKVVCWHLVPADVQAAVAELRSMLDKMLPEEGGTEINYASPGVGFIPFSSSGMITITPSTPTAPK